MNNLSSSLCYTDKNNIIFGNNKILCFGVCITGEEVWSRITAILALLLPCIYFNSTTLIWYYKNYGLAIPISIVLLDIVLLISYIAVSISDPGILPRHDSSSTFYDSLTHRRSKGVVPYIEVPINGVFLRIKYCSTCNIYRNPRTIHCNSCNVCVDRFDHHCKWLGNCVGSRNYCIFYLNITVLFILAMYMQVLCCYTIAIASTYGKEGYRNDIIQAAVCQAYLLLTSWFILGLFIYHTYLICTNQTTNEQLKGVYGDYNPWDKGVLNNIHEVLFRRRISTHYYHPYVKRKIYCQTFQRLDHLIVDEDLEAQTLKNTHDSKFFKAKNGVGNAGTHNVSSEINKSLGVYGCEDYETRFKMDNAMAEGINTFIEVENETDANLTKISFDRTEEPLPESHPESSVYCKMIDKEKFDLAYRYNPVYDLTKTRTCYTSCNLNNNKDNKCTVDPAPVFAEGEDCIAGDTVEETKPMCLNSTVVTRDMNELCDAIDLTTAKFSGITSVTLADM